MYVRAHLQDSTACRLHLCVLNIYHPSLQTDRPTDHKKNTHTEADRPRRIGVNSGTLHLVLLVPCPPPSHFCIR